MKALLQWITIGTAAVAAHGQDPLQLLAKNYQLAFENDFVRVLRCHYGAHEKLPVHDHSKTSTVYVYLSDAGPVRFNHTGSEPFELQRPAVRKGGYRLSPGVVETHEVVNGSDTPSDFLRVELKTVPLGTSSLRGRFAPPANLDQSETKMEFEDANLRILRTICGAHDKCELATSPNPALEIVFAPDSMRGLETGQIRWIPRGSTNIIQDTGTTPAHLLRLEFKRGPLND